ncbi:YaiO family outer membrane protein [Methylobacter tundripaludum]|uniref:YaiO family outer membrane protein n=1 Tax=Methylobacter tundripaludum TaxID=173365 RepID=A0A2S6H575_9GAMM|nr:YaiO family outer membrane beta-barrel protein [Methylobacter tundripaludum]PPK72581.1 YaiO family outer membrane protein [Methylobacter tundripaludum]
MTSKFVAAVFMACLIGLSSAPVAADDAWQKAQAAVELKQWGDAEAQLKTWLGQRPQDNEARFLLARVLAWQAKYEESVGQYTFLLRLEPNNADYLLGLGQVYFWQSRPRVAIPFLKRAQKSAPQYAEVWELLIRCLYAADERREAENIQRQAAQRFPDRHWQRLTPEPPVMQAPAESISPASERNTIFDVGGSYEKLDRGYDSWNSAYLGANHRLGDRRNIYGRATQVDRFALQDASIMAGFTLPVSERWTVGLETDESPTNLFLPKWSLLGNAHYKMDYGFGALFSFRHISYRIENNEIGTVGLERYWGNWHLAYTLYVSQLEAAPRPTFSHLGQVAYYYGDHDYIGVSISNGQEVVRIDPSRLVNADTESYSLRGQHWLTPALAVVYDVSLNLQGTSYTRRGAVFGLRYAF